MIAWARWGSIIVVGIASLACKAESSSPFDPSRSITLEQRLSLKKGAPEKDQISAGANGATQKPEVNVLCGISQSMDNVSFCIDDQWLGLKQFESKFHRKVVTVLRYSMKVSGRKNIWVIGEPLYYTQNRSEPGPNGEKK